jgi:hypothetical protein
VEGQRRRHRHAAAGGRHQAHHVRTGGQEVAQRPHKVLFLQLDQDKVVASVYVQVCTPVHIVSIANTNTS